MRPGRKHVIDGPSRMAANNTQMLVAAALAGVGVAYGPTFVFGEQISPGRLVELLPDYRASELAIHAVYPSTRHVPVKVRNLIDHLVAAFGNEPPWDRTMNRKKTTRRRANGEPQRRSA